MLKRPLGSGAEEVEPEASAVAIFAGNRRFLEQPRGVRGVCVDGGRDRPRVISRRGDYAPPVVLGGRRSGRLLPDRHRCPTVGASALAIAETIDEECP